MPSDTGAAARLLFSTTASQPTTAAGPAACPQVEQQLAVTDDPNENWGDMYACEHCLVGRRCCLADSPADAVAG